MTKTRRRAGTSLFRRLVYFVIVLISGTGAGGYVFQGHPVVKSLLSIVAGVPVDGTKTALDGSLLNEIVGTIAAPDAFTKPGLYQVAVAKVELDQKLFRPGHTVDIQARVKKISPTGRDTTLWDAKEFGSRLAVVGKDALNAGWSDRPFQVAWQPGDRFVLEVYDAKTNLFVQPRRFVLAEAEKSAAAFPFKSGDFPLESAQRSEPPVDPRANHIVLQSQRLGDLRSTVGPTAEVADQQEPVVIR